jgi:hypothetical protein
MGKVVNITGSQRKGAYEDIVDFLSDMAAQFGSATSAAAVLLRRTREYQRWLNSRGRALDTATKRKAG